MKPLIFHAIYRQHANPVALAAKSIFLARHRIPARRFRAALLARRLAKTG